jgi:cyclopropane fatty-acyl-phospholipid synthase-like methyltransferase
LVTGKSNYANYRWEPELTFPLAMTLIDYLGIKKGQTILEIGCAKGYLVKALRILHREAWGIDISDYALSHVPEDVKAFCHTLGTLDNVFFNFCIAKDVFEHIPIEELSEMLQKLNASILFAIIPLGENGKYNAEVNNMDKSHIICENADWWEHFFFETGWLLINFSYHVEGIKESYSSIPRAHGFFTLEKR